MADTQTLPSPFGQYTLVRKIAMGGMAEIFKATRSPELGKPRTLVVKRILPSYTDDESFVKMFIDEAAITSKLTHPNIVQVFDFDMVEGSYYLAMELIEGVDLKQIIKRGLQEAKPMPPLDAARIISETSKGLHYAHIKEYQGQPLHIVHRDISPQNIMVSFSGNVKLMDFGIAKAAERSTKTMAGMVKGKVAYMSPEQARGKDLDGRSDLFALGILFWEMLTGKRLFLGDSDFATLTNILKSDAPPPSQFNSEVPKELDAIILKALAKDRDERYASVEAFRLDLDAWIQSLGKGDQKEALHAYLEELFAEEIATLAEQNLIDGTPSEEFEMEAEASPEAASPEKDADPLPPAQTEVQVSADAATILDNSISIEDVQRELARLRPQRKERPSEVDLQAVPLASPEASPLEAQQAAPPKASPAPTASTNVWKWLSIVLMLALLAVVALFFLSD